MSSIFRRTHSPVMEFLGQLAMIASVAAAVLYPLYILPFNPSYVKGSAVTLLALYTLFRFKSFDHFILIIALLANAVGDIQIESPEAGGMYEAMKSFMVGHVLLILIFMRNRMSVYEVSSTRIGVAAILWGLGAASIFLLWPDLTVERELTIIYTSALIAMATAGLFSRFEYKLVGYGGVLFVISDGLIAARVFLDAPDWLGTVTWGLYYLSQILITAGILLAPDRDKPLHFR